MKLGGGVQSITGYIVQYTIIVGRTNTFYTLRRNASPETNAPFLSVRRRFAAAKRYFLIRGLTLRVCPRSALNLLYLSSLFLPWCMVLLLDVL